MSLHSQAIPEIPSETRGQPALAPWRLALVTIMQFLKNLTDRQAAVQGAGSPFYGSTDPESST